MPGHAPPAGGHGDGHLQPVGGLPLGHGGFDTGPTLAIVTGVLRQLKAMPNKP